MSNKGSVLNGLVEKVLLKALSKLTTDASGNLRVTNTPSGTQTITGSISGTVTAVVASTQIATGNQSLSGASQADSQLLMASNFRRNLIVT